jgi:hypothetical protein
MTTPFIISTKLVRRFPFAVHPARIRDIDEEAIAQHMAKAMHREGHRPKMPVNPITIDAEQQRQSRRDKALAVLRDHGELPTRGVAWRAGYDPRYANSALNELCMERLVRRTRRAGSEQMWEAV